MSEDDKTICEQDDSDSKQLLGDDLTDNVKKAKTTHWVSSLNHSLNLQDRKKNFQHQQPITRWNQKKQPRMKQN